MLKPMLAAPVGSLDDLKFPLIASTKLDGIRAIITDDGPRTRSLKPVPNAHINTLLATLPPGLDGELGTGSPIDFRTTTGNVMRREGTPDFTYFVFDNFKVAGGFEERSRSLVNDLKLPSWVTILPQHTVHNAAEVRALFAAALAEGNEGIILRDPKGLYKHGRSTLKEQGMLKVKPWEDAEAICIDVIEEQHNGNDSKTNELGRTARSSSKAGKTGKGTMGTLVVRSPRWPNSFEIGTGFTASDRAELWANKPVGQLIKFKYVTVGAYDVPRHTVYLGIRHGDDT